MDSLNLSTKRHFALITKGLDVKRQIQVPVWFRQQKVGDFTADVLVNQSVLLELKADSTDW